MQSQFDKGDNAKAMTEHPQDQQPRDASYGQQPGEPMPPDNPQAPPYYGAQPTPPGSVPGWAPAYGGHRGQPPVSPADALVYKDRDPFIRRHAAQVLNFHIFVVILYLVTIPLIFVGLYFFPPLIMVIVIVAWVAIVICMLVFTIMGAVAAHHGREYTYPLTPRMVT